MALHRFILHPLSPWSTPFRSDTLAGLLLCRLAEDEGEAALQKELDAFKKGTPPFALSSAMPEGTVFSPRLPPASRERFARMVKEGRFRSREGKELSLFEALAAYKKFRKQPFLPLAVWERHCSSLSAAALFEEYCQHPERWKSSPVIRSQEMHVTISRNSGSALQGGLFASHSLRSSRSFHLYAETEDAEGLLARLRRMGQIGFGKDSSTGKGVFSIEEDTSFTAPSSSLPHGLLLSMLSANDWRGLAGWYSTEVKTGKVGPAFSGGNPFKSPFLCVQEGAVLTALPKGPFILNGIHANPAIIQITQPLTLPCALAEEEVCHAC